MPPLGSPDRGAPRVLLGSPDGVAPDSDGRDSDGRHVLSGGGVPIVTIC